MRDLLEEQLAAVLHELGETLPDELAVPEDLELRVARRRRQTRAARRWPLLAIAAAVVAAVTIGLVAGGASRPRPVTVSNPPATRLETDPLPAGTVMLSARGLDVIALDASGHQLATMVHVRRGTLRDVQVTADHSQIWYLSIGDGQVCGDVVRADIRHHESRIVANATAFAISADGSRLALAHTCQGPDAKTAHSNVVIRDLRSGASEAHNDEFVAQLRWVGDGSLVSRSCEGEGVCAFLVRQFPTSVRAGAQWQGSCASLALCRDATASSGWAAVAPFAVGADGIYALDGPANPVRADRVERRPVDALTPARAVTLARVGSGWRLAQVIPTPRGVLVVAIHPGASSAGLYRVSGGHLALVRPLTDPGTLVPVFPAQSS